ncbi:hypothetical protein TNCV_2346811 [Trichonephila clavipes]|nr:hypothetical protein TNCV_2346811 [Trichonephila clavipes]
MINLDTNTRFAFPKRNVTTDWESFRALLSSALHTFQPITAHGEDVEKQSADLTTKILNAHARSSKPVKQHKHYYVSDEIKSLMKERNRARKIWQKYKKSKRQENSQHSTEQNSQESSCLPI